MVQTRITENLPKRRATAGRSASEKRKAKSVKDLSLNENVEELAHQHQIADENTIESIRKAFDTSSPENLPGREAQIMEVYEFLNPRITQKLPGSMYISGAPGTGKTAVVRFTLDRIARERKTGKKALGFHQIFVNCMCKRSAKEIYEVIWDTVKTARSSGKSLREKVEDKIFSKSKSANMIVIVLDEMDQILQERNGSNEVLYSLFEWARTPNSKLVLIGIANALDLTVRHLPFLHLNSSPVKRSQAAVASDNQCKTMNFPPYQRDDIEKIIQERMQQIGQDIFNAAAIKFVASKVAASTGDARKALHACKEAMVTVEKQETRSVLQSSDDNSLTLSSEMSPPKRTCIRNDQIGIVAVSKALQIKKDEGPLPLQQVTILAALLKTHREAPNTRDSLVDGVNKPIPMPVLYKQYRKICSLKGFSWIEESELPLVCEVLQDRSLLSVVNTGNSTGKKLSMGNKKFGSPSASGNNKIGVLFDPRATEALVLQGDMQNLFA